MASKKIIEESSLFVARKKQTTTSKQEVHDLMTVDPIGAKGIGQQVLNRLCGLGSKGKSSMIEQTGACEVVGRRERERRHNGVGERKSKWVSDKNP